MIALDDSSRSHWTIRTEVRTRTNRAVERRHCSRPRANAVFAFHRVRPQWKRENQSTSGIDVALVETSRSNSSTRNVSGLNSGDKKKTKIIRNNNVAGAIFHAREIVRVTTV